MKDRWAEVRIREGGRTVAVKVASEGKPVVPETVKKGWQGILDLLAEAMDVPSALIMEIKEKHIEVFLAGKKMGNPYHEGDSEHLGIGLYCETVLGENRPLEVPFALADPAWSDNPDVKLDMISYYGLPLAWPGGEMFGTICVLDDKRRSYSKVQKQIIEAFSRLVEKDLILLEKTAEIERTNERLTEMSMRDGLTGLYNHRAIHEFLFVEIQNAVRYERKLTIAMVDLDGFKEINDHYGHKTGDILLKEMADLMKENLRESDILGRYGGDEFLVVFTDTGKEEAFKVIERLRKKAENDKEFSLGVTISAGLAFLDERCTADELIKQADLALYKAKKRGRNRVVDY